MRSWSSGAPGSSAPTSRPAVGDCHTVDVVETCPTVLCEPRLARAEHIGSLKFHNVDVRQPELIELLGAAAGGRCASGLPSSGPPARVCRRRGGTANLLDAARRRRDEEVVVGLDAVAYTAPCRSGSSRSRRARWGRLVERDDRPAGGADLLALYREPTRSSHGPGAGQRLRHPAAAGRGVVAAFWRPAKPATRRGLRHGQADARLRRRRRRRSTPLCARGRPAVRASSSTSGPVCRRRSPRSTSRCWACRWRPRCADRRGGRRRSVRAVPGACPHPSGLGAVDGRGTGIGQLLAELAASTPPEPPAPPAPSAPDPPEPEPSGRELVNGVAGADDAALHDAGVDPAQMEFPPDR